MMNCFAKQKRHSRKKNLIGPKHNLRLPIAIPIHHPTDQTLLKMIIGNLSRIRSLDLNLSLIKRVSDPPKMVIIRISRVTTNRMRTKRLHDARGERRIMGIPPTDITPIPDSVVSNRIHLRTGILMLKKISTPRMALSIRIIDVESTRIHFPPRAPIFIPAMLQKVSTSKVLLRIGGRLVRINHPHLMVLVHNIITRHTTERAIPVQKRANILQKHLESQKMAIRAKIAYVSSDIAINTRIKTQ